MKEIAQRVFRETLAAIDIPTLLAQTGDILEAKHNEAGATTFRIRKS